ncbi:MAG: hypothetical protein JW969_02650 [Spirochaetales bacterium]|nr:hypothetical protein [Spirochaetales bacterium]
MNDAVREHLNRILSQEKFHYDIDRIPDNKEAVNPLSDLLNGVIRAILDFLSNVWDFSPLLAVLLGVVVLGLIVFLIVFIVRKMSFSKSLKERLSYSGVKENLADNRQYLKFINGLMEAGEFKKAINHLCILLWKHFNALKILVFTKSRTNREFLAGLKAHMDYEKVRDIIMESEMLVYFRETVVENECRSVYDKITGYITG